MTVDDCPPALTILNIGQFITDEEMVGAWESHTGSWPTPVHCSGWVRWPTGGNGSGQDQSLPTGTCLLV